MVFLTVGIVIFSFFFKYFFLSLTDLSGALHTACLNQTPETPYKVFYQALACGERPPSSSEILLLKQLGIIHIMVVSGFHILMLNRVFHLILRGPFLSLLKPFFLFAFVMTCQFQLPVVRAWIQSLLLGLNKKCSLQIPKPLTLFLSILICLLIFPEKYASLSLPLSWVACLGIQLGRNHWSQSCFTYLLIMPVLSSFAALSPWTILINCLFAPLIGLILFPLSLLCFFISDLSFYVDHLWLALLWSGEKVMPLITNPEPHPLLSLTVLNWFYPLILNLWLVYRWKSSVR